MKSTHRLTKLWIHVRLVRVARHREEQRVVGEEEAEQRVDRVDRDHQHDPDDVAWRCGRRYSSARARGRAVIAHETTAHADATPGTIVWSTSQSVSGHWGLRSSTWLPPWRASIVGSRRCRLLGRRGEDPRARHVCVCAPRWRSSSAEKRRESGPCPKPARRSTPPLIEEAPRSSAPPKWVAPALRWYHWVVVVLVDMIGPFSTDSYIPNLPQMTKDLHTTASLAGATLQFNWIVKASARSRSASSRTARRSAPAARDPRRVRLLRRRHRGLRARPRRARRGRELLADRLPRRAGGRRAATAVTSAVARDVLSDPDEMMRMMALLGSLRPLMIVVAPSVGGVLGSLFGWRLVFAGLCGLGVADGGPRLLPPARDARAARPRRRRRAERPSARRARRGARAAARARECFASRSAASDTFALSFGGIMTMLSNISFVLEDRFGIASVRAGLLIGSIPVCIMSVNGGVAVLSRVSRRGGAPPRPTRRGRLRRRQPAGAPPPPGGRRRPLALVRLSLAAMACAAGLRRGRARRAVARRGCGAAAAAVARAALVGHCRFTLRTHQHLGPQSSGMPAPWRCT